MAKQTELVRVLRAIPPKWALGIVGLLVGYWLLQPVANRTFGWHLPTLVAIINNDYSTSDKKPSNTKLETEESETGKKRDKQAPTSQSAGDKNKTPTAKSATEKPVEKPVEKTATQTAAKPTTTKPSSATPTNVKRIDSATSSEQIVAEGPTYGYLKSIGRDRYKSPEGLVYGPGSEEGHRLKHIERHTENIPNRPGSHGVFEGSMANFLTTIDKGYRMAISKGKGTKSRDEDGLTVLEITFEKKIGYVGGSDGKRKGTPSTKRLRIVLNGDRLITAFPY